MSKIEPKNITDRRMILFAFVERIAQLFIVLNVLGIVFFVGLAVERENWVMGATGILTGAAGILFCIMVIAVFSIQEEVSGMRHAQLKANDIDEESMKLLRFMAKRLADKQGK